MNESFTQAEGSTIDNEHTTQIRLLNLLSKAVSENREDSEKEEILEQLISFTQIHFASEKLIMRQHSYEGYDEHDSEHEQLLEGLNDLKQQIRSSPTGLDPQSLSNLRGMLLQHIGSQDQRFAAFLAD